MSGSLPPDLQGTLLRVGPAWPWGAARAPAARGAAGEGEREREREREGEREAEAAWHGGEKAGALHAVELRDGKAVWYRRQESDADAGVLWHAGSVLALPETGIPSQYSRFLEAEEFAGRLTVPIASHVPRLASDGGRVLFGVDDGSDDLVDGDSASGDGEGIFLRIGEWDAAGALRSAQSVELERATWQHDIGVTAGHVVFIESPTTRVGGGDGGGGGGGGGGVAVPFGWVPGAEGWLGVVPRGGDGSAAQWIRLDPCLVTHILGAYDEPRGDGAVGDGAAADGAARDGAVGDGAIVLYVCRYGVPEAGQAVDLASSVVGPAGIGLSAIGGTLGVVERWRIVGGEIEQIQVDERYVEYPRTDAQCEGAYFRYGYALETEWATGPPTGTGGGRAPDRYPEARPVGVVKFDLARDEVASWSPGPGCTPSEPLFVRAVDGHTDDEGWLLIIVDDANRGASDLYVLDASSLGRRRPEAVIHLPVRLPVRSHGEWVPADRYR
jgi:carotenoid cleavage dioxygenase-like enzyme